MSYRYYIYGMHIESDIEIPEALVDTGKACAETGEAYADSSEISADSSETYAEVCFRLAPMPEPERSELLTKPVDQFTIKKIQDGVVFRIADVADYYVTKDFITVEVRENAIPNDVKCFLLGSACGFMLFLRGMVAIHGGGICHNGKGIVITGESGAGKSTVSNALRELGYEFLADDVCVIDTHNETRINLAYPQQKLCRDAALNKGYSLDDLIYINESRDKFAVRLQDGYKKDGEVFSYLFEIVLTDEEQVSITRLKGYDALQAVIRNVYRGRESASIFGTNPLYMKSVVTITKNVEIYQIKRPKDGDTLDYIVGEVDRIVTGR